MHSNIITLSVLLAWSVSDVCLKAEKGYLTGYAGALDTKPMCAFRGGFWESVLECL